MRAYPEPWRGSPSGSSAASCKSADALGQAPRGDCRFYVRRAVSDVLAHGADRSHARHADGPGFPYVLPR
jgi:hypothetical protein